MIPIEIMEILMAFSKRDKNNDMVLIDDAPPQIVELAKQYYWKPYNKKDGEEIQV